MTRRGVSRFVIVLLPLYTRRSNAEHAAPACRGERSRSARGRARSRCFVLIPYVSLTVQLEVRTANCTAASSQRADSALRCFLLQSLLLSLFLCPLPSVLSPPSKTILRGQLTMSNVSYPTLPPRSSGPPSPQLDLAYAAAPEIPAYEQLDAAPQASHTFVQQPPPQHSPVPAQQQPAPKQTFFMKASENKWAKRATKISDAIGVRANAVGEKFGAERELRRTWQPGAAGRTLTIPDQVSGQRRETATSS